MSQNPITLITKPLQSRGFRRTAAGINVMAGIAAFAVICLVVGLAIGLFNVEAWEWITAIWWGFPSILMVPWVPAAAALMACACSRGREAFQLRLHDSIGILLTILMTTWLIQGIYLAFRAATNLQWVAMSSPAFTAIWVTVASAFGFGLHAAKTAILREHPQQ